MTHEEKLAKLESLRQAYKTATTEVDRKIILVRANLIKKSIKTLV